MATITLTGWKPGLQKISLVNLIRGSTGLSLAPAKHAVDQMLNGEHVLLNLSTPAEAKKFISAATRLGAVCEPSFELRLQENR